MTVREAAEKLGNSRETVRRLILCGDLPAVRTGAGKVRPQYRITEEDLAAFVESRRTRPAIPPPQPPPDRPLPKLQHLEW